MISIILGALTGIAVIGAHYWIRTAGVKRRARHARDRQAARQRAAAYLRNAREHTGMSRLLRDVRQEDQT